MVTKSLSFRAVKLKTKIAPSILGADYGDLNHYLQKLEPFSDLFHVDVMDGNFVPNLTIGAVVVNAIKTTIPLDCHLMINHPEEYIEDFAKAGAHIITVHAEATRDLKKTIEKIHDLGCLAGVSIDPKTPVSKIQKVLPLVDLVLIMSVEPGFGGQAFMPEVLPKIVQIRKAYPELDIEVDGGITHETAPLCKSAGANIFVAGSYILKADDPKAAAEKLRKAVS
ncbi:ribulose-phosphate 3-epimerase [Candidatus Peregrinibacteria bacterium]|nr:ribulose-phosphate 3-epimerase [Candidatus Peregrinibacteria bacterium]